MYASDFQHVVAVPTSTTSYLIWAYAVSIAPRNRAAFEEQILLWLTNLRASDTEVLAAFEGRADVDIQRSREESLSRGALEDFWVARHSRAKVLHAFRNATGDFHARRLLGTAVQSVRSV